MRKIVLDVETTGIDPEEGHRVISLGCVELIKDSPGQEQEWFFNPDRDIPPESFNIHGISEEFLSTKPSFKEQAEEILGFLGDETPLVIHNAKFDVSFINAELKLCSLKPLANPVIDTLPMAREMFVGKGASLDELADRLQVSRAERQKHGALLDARILAGVYLKMLEVKQKTPAPVERIKRQKEGIILRASARETAAHEEILAKIGLKNWGSVDG